MTRPPSAALLDLLAGRDPHVVEVALATREVVIEEVPDATEIVYDANYAVSIIFTFTGKWTTSFLYVAVYTNWVNIGFTHGASMPDPSGVLEGEGKQMRHIRIATLRDLDRPFIRPYIQTAAERAPRLQQPLKPVGKKTTTTRRRPSKRAES